ncbi:CaiB/BaiF CoA transferase family protein [Paracoccus endophyticus]|uniref:CaiB/BaiF CoA transferase family protein n=1 Tax=Paracoccus endophyticus TaxID=2233774 RepID=UPI000DDAD912|nr:CoA transferase [Paracoccus endophyticus]
MPQQQQPLAGVRVLDFTRVLAGPYATALMADLGADVIKVEAPDGDEYRHVGPFRDGESALFQTVNRGKRSIVLDLRAPDDLALARRLADRADVVVENFRPGVMARLGLDAATLQAGNAGLVYASVSGFGQGGPNAARPAYDIIVQAMAGLMAQTGEADGPPTMVGEALADVAGGLFAAWGIMVALFDRSRTGRGRVVDIALFDALLSMMPTAGARVLVTDADPVRTGNRHALSAPFGVYPAGQGHFAVAVLNDKLFAAFCHVIGRPELAADPRFAGDAARRTNEPQLAEAIAGWAGTLTAAQAVAALSAAGVPASELATARQAWLSDQAQARGLSSVAQHPALGPLSLPEQPVHFSDSPRGGRRAAPALDQHGAQIRAELEDVQ